MVTMPAENSRIDRPTTSALWVAAVFEATSPDAGDVDGGADGGLDGPTMTRAAACTRERGQEPMDDEVGECDDCSCRDESTHAGRHTPACALLASGLDDAATAARKMVPAPLRSHAITSGTSGQPADRGPACGAARCPPPCPEARPGARRTTR